METLEALQLQYNQLRSAIQSAEDNKILNDYSYPIQKQQQLARLAAIQDKILKLQAASGK